MEKPTSDEIKKNMKRIGGYVLPSGSRYGAYSDGKVLVGIHEDDDEIVSILDIAKREFTYIDENVKIGLKVFEAMLKEGRL